MGSIPIHSRSFSSAGTPVAFLHSHRNYLTEGSGALVPANRSDIMLKKRIQRAANMRWGLIALLLGLPLPIVLIAFLFFGGCR